MFDVLQLEDKNEIFSIFQYYNHLLVPSVHENSNLKSIDPKKLISLEKESFRLWEVYEEVASLIIQAYESKEDNKENYFNEIKRLIEGDYYEKY